MIPSKPRWGERLLRQNLSAGDQLRRFLDDVASLPFGDIQVAADCEVTAARVYVDASAGPVQITPKSWPVTVVKIDGGADAVTFSQPVNGNPAYALSSQWDKVTIGNNNGQWVAL